MSTGKTSNYLDSGYDITSLASTFYSDNNNQVTTANVSTDIYTNTQTTGVIMINQSGLSYAIYCSVTDLTYIGATNNTDDYYIVYPGWGFTLYTSTNYTGTQSLNYINNTTSPKLYVLNGATTPTISANVLQQTGTNYNTNSTKSIKVYFRGIEVTVSGLS